MIKTLSVPIDQTLAQWWANLDPTLKRASAILIVINLLAFGFEMTNLTLHHDDVSHIFIEDTILGHYLGRFAFGYLHYYTQNAYVAPFLQIAQAIVFMTIYGIVIARFWGNRRTLDTVLPAAIVCVFPYMAQIYQYNACAAPFALAHLVVAVAVVLSVRATAASLVGAIALHVLAYSIYQSVLANGVAILGIWILCRLLTAHDRVRDTLTALLKPVASALLAFAIAGAVYLAVVSAVDLKFDAYQSADKAFTLNKAFDIRKIVDALALGSRAFFLWPESYFPGYLKSAQLVLIVGAGAMTLWLPQKLGAKVAAFAVLALTILAPRALQVAHLDGNFHALTLTGYAIVIAGSVAVVVQLAPVLARNLTTAVATFVIAAYLLQANWISTVNHLNTQAHVATLTQILARVRSLPDKNWDGKTIAVVGQYDMKNDYPFKPATGVAVEYLRAHHMDKLARLMRDQAEFVNATPQMQGVLEYAAAHSTWPHPESVAIVNGIGVVVLSKP